MTNAVYDILAGTGLSPLYEFESKVSDEVKARLAELEAGIISGEIDPLK